MATTTRSSARSGDVAGLLPTVILPCIQHTNAELRNAAVRCLGLYVRARTHTRTQTHAHPRK